MLNNVNMARKKKTMTARLLTQKRVLRATLKRAGKTQDQLATHVDISRSAVSQWFKMSATTWPDWDNFVSAMQFLGTTPDEFLQEVEVDLMSNTTYKDTAKAKNALHLVRTAAGDNSAANVRQMSKSLGDVPLIQLSEVGRQDTMVATKTAPEPLNSKPETRASLVEGNAMQADSSRSYPDGCYVYWLDATDAKIGQVVIAKLSDDSRIIRELDKDGSNFVLRPLNSQYPIISDNFEIVARVTGRFIPEPE